MHLRPGIDELIKKISITWVIHVIAYYFMSMNIYPLYTGCIKLNLIGGHWMQFMGIVSTYKGYITLILAFLDTHPLLDFVTNSKLPTHPLMCNITLWLSIGYFSQNWTATLFLDLEPWDVTSRNFGGCQRLSMRSFCLISIFFFLHTLLDQRSWIQ